MTHNIALLGFGTVGQGLCEILRDKSAFLKDKYGFEYSIVAVADFAFGNVYNPNGLDVDLMLKEAAAKQKFTKDVVNMDNVRYYQAQFYFAKTLSIKKIKR